MQSENLFSLPNYFFNLQLTSKGEGAGAGEGDEDGEGGRQEGVDHCRQCAAQCH